MWYSVLRSEAKLATSFSLVANVPSPLQEVKYRAGTVFQVRKSYDVFVRMDRIDMDGKFVDPREFVLVSVDEARALFTKPSKVLSDVIEESIMVCEAAYC
jgi:hypothetical protein